MKKARRARKSQQEEEEGHLDELHDQEQLTRRLVHLDQLDDAGVSDPSQHCHFVFYQMLLFTHGTASQSLIFVFFNLRNGGRCQLTFPQQRALSMIFRAYSCPVNLSIKSASATSQLSSLSDA